MGQQDDLAALVGNFGDGRGDTLEPGRVGNAAVLHGNVEVDAQQHALGLDVDVIEGTKTLGHGISYEPPWVIFGQSSFLRVGSGLILLPDRKNRNSRPPTIATSRMRATSCRIMAFPGLREASLQQL